MTTRDYGVEVWWRSLLDRGPTCLLKEDWSHLETRLKFSDTDKAIFRRMLDRMDSQTKWIVERTEAMRNEAERMKMLGETMRRAGLRSYTDEHGCIFVAAKGDGDE